MRKIIALLLIVLMSSCSNQDIISALDINPSDYDSREDDTDKDSDETDYFDLSEIKIVETPAQTLMDSLTYYEDVNGCFTANIPEGWEVSTAGFDMIYWIRIYDPDNPNLQVFTLLKTECLLMDENSKTFYESMRGYDLYTMFADMIVVTSVEDFYKQFMDFCSFMAVYETTYAGFEYPQISSFETLETFDYGSLMASYAFEDSLLHGTFVNNYTGEMGEGMFAGSLCRGFEANGVGCNMLYNINAATAPYGEFNEYEELLSEIFSSIQYTDDFLNTVINDLQIKAEAASQLNTTLSETSEIITDSWNERQKTYDIISEKQSDATLGYERVYDVETGEVYRADNGFTDISGVDAFYQPITDDMYSEPVVGYIIK